MELVSSTMLSEEDAPPAPRHKPVFDLPEDGRSLGSLDSYRDGQPFDYFAQLRAKAPIAWMEGSTPNFDEKGFWAFTRYDDIKQAGLQPTIYSNQRGSMHISTGPKKQRENRLSRAAVNSLICLDKDYHIPLRMQQRSFFTPQFVASIREKVVQKVDKMLDIMAQKGPVIDLVPLFSEQLPLYTLCETLGVDERDRPHIIRWMHYLEMAQEHYRNRMQGKASLIFLLKFLYNTRRMFQYGERVLLERRKNPRDDLLTAIATAEVGNEKLNQAYLDGSWLLIIFAGNDTTRNSISGTMKLLSDFPEQKQSIIDEPSRIKKLVPEALRMVSPVMTMRRTLMQDVELRGQTMAKDEKVTLFFGAANRDPEVFENPDEMDLDRHNAKDHIAFGHGPHNCLGKHMAVMQLEVAYERLLARFPDAKQVGKEQYTPSNLINVYHSIMVDLGKERNA